MYNVTYRTLKLRYWTNNRKGKGEFIFERVSIDTIRLYKKYKYGNPIYVGSFELSKLQKLIDDIMVVKSVKK